uniref:Putative ixostatin n=1 Tax=Ixodes ricinus TaxID=34613 RepID=A0A0K8RAF3_IXORI
MQILIFAVVLILPAVQIDAISKIRMDGYVSRDKTHMAPLCKTALESRMQTRCRQPAFYPGNGKPVDFDGCGFTCTFTYGTTTASQRVHLRNGIPCGPNGEICVNGTCVGGTKPKLPPITCDISFVPKSPYETGNPPNS